VRLVVDNLAVARGERPVFAGLSFTVGAGEALLIKGRNGAGKTTLLRAIAGFIRPATGRIALEGGDGERTLGEQCHWVGHLDAVKPALTVAENLVFLARYLGGVGAGEGRARADAAMVRLNLEDLAGFPAGYLSAGQRRRLSLARLLVAQRALWLLDEPGVSLDAPSVELLAGVMREQLAGRGLILAATHSDLGLTGARMLEIGSTSVGADI
jgi:heme exporter protein A